MRLRKQSKPAAQPGDEFLRAVSSGPARRPAAERPRHDDEDISSMRQQLLESDRRAAAADEALRQMREQRDERLEQAREALAREREAREAVERRLAEVLERPAEQAPPPPPEPAVEAAAAESEREPPEPEPGLAFPDSGEAGPGGDGAQEGDWPAPWLEQESRPKRGLFRRSRS